MNKTIEDKIKFKEAEIASIKTMHIIHFILTIFTVWWVFIWIARAIINDEKRRKLRREIFELKK